jgi:hypothetical protein
MKTVEYLTPRTGRMYRESDAVVNMADYLTVTGTTISADASNAWAASAVTTTTKINTWTKPTNPKTKYEFIVSNPSLISDLTWTVHNLETGFNSETRRSKVATATIAKSTSAVIEDCEDAWNEQVISGVTASATTVSAVVGTNCAKFAIHSSITNSIIGSELIASTNMTPYTHVNFYLNSDIDVTQSGKIQLLLDNTANCASPLETIDIPAFTSVSAGQWISVPLANPASDGAIISIGVKQTAGLGIWNLKLDDVKGVKLSTISTLVEGAFNGTDVEETKSNDTALGANGAFTSITRVRER